MIKCKDCHYGKERWTTELQKAHAAKHDWPERECRFNPPVTAVDSDGNELAPWPLVRNEDGCGRGVRDGDDSKEERLTKLFAESVLTLGDLMARGDEIAGRVVQSSGIHRYM